MQITDLSLLLPLLLGFLTQEQLVAQKRQKTLKQALSFGGLLALLFFLFTLINDSKSSSGKLQLSSSRREIQIAKSTPSWQQPDHKHEAPALDHETKPQKLYYDWMFNIQDSRFVSKKSEPGDPGDYGENFDDERFWRERLEQIISYIIALREGGYLYELENITKLNGWMLKEIFAICSRFGIPLHGVLVRALGENYSIDIGFIQTHPEYIDAVVILHPSGANTEEVIESFSGLPGELVGLLQIVGKGTKVLFEETMVAGRITIRAWKSLTRSIEEFLNPSPRFPGGPINPN